MYGTYDDVSLSSFMEVQLNSSYRTDWDDTALELKVLNSHEDSNSDLLYWLVKFPVSFTDIVVNFLTLLERHQMYRITCNILLCSCPRLPCQHTATHNAKTIQTYHTVHSEYHTDLSHYSFQHFFANRDYVFKRRFRVDREKKEVVIMSEAVSADFLPAEKGVHRVNEYWSTMVIRAKGDMDQVWEDSCFVFVSA